MPSKTKKAAAAQALVRLTCGDATLLTRITSHAVEGLLLLLSLTRWMVSPSSDTARRPKICQNDMIAPFNNRYRYAYCLC